MRLNLEENTFQIGEIAESLGITTRTIRLYEKEGLIEPPQRTDGGVRFYSKPDIKRLKFVLKLKELGLSLQDMRELAELYNKGDKVPEKIMPRLIELLDSHLASIHEKVRKLASLEVDISGYRNRIVETFQLASQSDRTPSELHSSQDGAANRIAGTEGT
jgi:DNA-binding transcriptional MerR regulator